MFGVNPGQPFDGLGGNRFWSHLWSIFLMAVVATTFGINTCRCFLVWVVSVFGVNPSHFFDVVGGGRFWGQPRSTIRGSWWTASLEVRVFACLGLGGTYTFLESTPGPSIHPQQPLPLPHLPRFITTGVPSIAYGFVPRSRVVIRIDCLQLELW